MARAGANDPHRALMREIRSRHPRLKHAIPADARVTAAHRGDRYEFRSRTDAVVQALRLMWASDAFLAQTLYRVTDTPEDEQLTASV